MTKITVFTKYGGGEILPYELKMSKCLSNLSLLCYISVLCRIKQMVNQYQKVDFESLIEIISKKFE